MSEWDYMPTPYQSLVQKQSKHTILTFMTLVCMLQNKLMTPSNIFILASQNQKYSSQFNYVLNRTSVYQVVRSILQYQDLRTSDKRQKIIKVLKEYVDRTREENI